jgi:DNA-binding transcriptional LysR family regulator
MSRLAEHSAWREGRVAATPTPDTTEGVFVLVTGLWRSNECRPANGLPIRAGRWEMPVVATSALRPATDAAVCLPQRGGLDAAVVSDYAAGVIKTVGVVIEHLVHDPLVVALPAQHPLAQDTPLKLHDAGEGWIEGDPSETVVLRAAAQRAGFKARITHRVRDWNANLGFVAAGVGGALVPRLAITGMRSDVVFRSIPDDLPTRKIYVATTPASRTGPAVQHLVATARAVARDLSRTLA